jgi:MFS family permease
MEVTPLELVTAYAPFANGGLKVKPRLVKRIVRTDGEVLFETEPEITQAMDPRDAFQRIDQTGLGYLVASVAFGALVGSRAMTRPGIRAELPRIMLVSAVVWHVLVLGFAQMGSLPGGIAALLLCGVAQSVSMVPHTVLLLRGATERYRGRVTGVRMLAIYSLPLGLLIAGTLIPWIGFRATASLYAAVGLMFTIVIAVHWRGSLWQARNVEDVV